MLHGGKWKQALFNLAVKWWKNARQCDIVCSVLLSWGRNILTCLLSGSLVALLWLQISRSQPRTEAARIWGSNNSTDLKIQMLNPKDPGSTLKSLWTSLMFLPAHPVCTLFTGLVHVGDELREVNGVSVIHKRPDEISQLLVRWTEGHVNVRITPLKKQPSEKQMSFIH